MGGNTVATFARLVAATLPAASVDIMKNSFIATIQVVWRNCCLHPRGTSMDLGREKWDNQPIGSLGSTALLLVVRTRCTLASTSNHMRALRRHVALDFWTAGG